MTPIVHRDHDLIRLQPAPGRDLTAPMTPDEAERLARTLTAHAENARRYAEHGPQPLTQPPTREGEAA